MIGHLAELVGLRRQELALPAPYGKVSRFLLEHIQPSEGGKVALDFLATCYTPWCRLRGDRPLPRNDVYAEMDRLFTKVGVRLEPEKGRLYAIDVDLI